MESGPRGLAVPRAVEAEREEIIRARAVRRMEGLALVERSESGRSEDDL